MKRLWIGIVILSVLLSTGAGVTWLMWRIHSPITDQLEEAGQLALQNDWQQAHALAGNARQRWQNWRHFTAAFADHAPMDEMDSLFAELTVYADLQDAAHFSALCARLARLADAMADSHNPTWWNLL